MRRFFKWVGIVLASLAGLLLAALVILSFMGSSRLNKTYTFPDDQVSIPTDAAAIARGKHLVSMLCTDCHGADLAGVEGWFAPGPFGSIDSANLTAGEGGVGQEYRTDEDYVLAIRHGVDPEGKPAVMPAVVGFQHLSDEDLGNIIAYLKTVPPVAHETSGNNLSLLGKALIGAGLFGDLPVEAVSHAAHIPSPVPGVTAEYGKYLVLVSDCSSCHGKQLAGGPDPDPSVSVMVPNLTPGGELAGWTDRDFITAMRTGVVPGGRTLNPKIMPWKQYGTASDDELKAIWLYLHSLPKVATQ